MMPLLTVAAMIASVAGAAQPQLPRAGAVDAVLACQNEATADARLACYDRSVAALRQGLDSGTVVAVDPRQARRQSFGLDDPDVLGDAVREEIPDEITATVAASGESGFQRWQVVLDNGQVWRTIDSSRGASPPRAGSTVQISRGAIGNFWLRVGRRTYRAERVR